MDSISKMQKKLAVQRNEIGRLTREAEQLRADKRNLTFDMNKLRAKLRMQGEEWNDALDAVKAVRREYAFDEHDTLLLDMWHRDIEKLRRRADD